MVTLLHLLRDHVCDLEIRSLPPNSPNSPGGFNHGIANWVIPEKIVSGWLQEGDPGPGVTPAEAGAGGCTTK
jgi:hypothetical protein